MASSNRLRYPIREIQQRPLSLSIIFALNNRYDFASMRSTFCVSLYGLQEPFDDYTLRLYNQHCLAVRQAVH